MQAETDRGIEPRLLLLEQQAILPAPQRSLVAAGSLLTHLVLGLVLVNVPWTPPVAGGPQIIAKFRDVTPLVMPPPTQLTQKAPNQSKPALEVNLEGLLTKPSLRTPVPQRQGMLQPAAPKPVEAPPVRAPESPKPLIEAPKLELGPRHSGEVLARNLPGIGTPQLDPPPVRPPQIQAEEKPKLAFETPGGATGSPTQSGVAQGRVPFPQRSTVDDVARQVARSGGGGLVVGDLGEGIGGLGEALNNPSAPLRNGSNLELLSDPMGVDFKPYLIRVLSAVRRNWFAVIPESARLGRRGKVLIQFAISRDGAVPKLVIATNSGTEALDRAAVAGISASNPFPPLPNEFKGQQVRLQLTFFYNIPAR
jgi:TonB family protein